MAEPTPAAAEAAAAPPKSKKKLLLVIIAASVVLVGGGAGAYFFFMGKPAEEQVAKDGKAGKDGKATKAEKGKKKHEEEKKPKLPAQFVELDPPFVVNFEPGASARFLQISVQLMTREPEMVEFLKANTPIIRNDLLLLFGNRHVEEVATNEGKETLRTAALQTVRKIIDTEGGKGEALENVYFTSFVMQ